MTPLSESICCSMSNDRKGDGRMKVYAYLNRSYIPIGHLHLRRRRVKGHEISG